MPVGYLVLENGKIFTGELLGSSDEVTGEIVFSTSSTGFFGMVTDKSHYKQIVLQTFPQIGNYGVVSSVAESDKPQIAGLIVKYVCEYPSNFQSEGTLNDYFVKNNITVLCGIDTRALTKLIRDNGSLNGKITSNLDKIDLNRIKQFKVTNAVADVSCKGLYLVKPPKSLYKVAVFDFGINESIKRELLKKGCDLYVFPHNSPAELIKKIEPDGVLLSGGPSDPNENTEIIKNLRELIKYNIPIFGMGLGHLLLALANGFSTEKLKPGHRGENQAVKDLISGSTYITNQNHGYAVSARSINKKAAELSFINVNDRTTEGINYKNIPAFSVQFNPSQNTDFLFDKFIKMMEDYNAAE